MKKLRAAIYIRVSTQDQNSALQRADLEQFIAAQGWECAGVYEDVMSGAKSSRPGLNRLLQDAQDGKLDVVLVWKLDRFGRSLVDCLRNIETLEQHGVTFIATTQNLNTSHNDPAGRFLLHILGAAAEFERSLIKDRVHAGLKQAKRDGKQLGRPKLVFSRNEVARLRAEGLSIREISRNMSLTVATVHRTLKAA
jgi:putative DNA-invertase from lambdoid prophage Rac